MSVRSDFDDVIPVQAILAAVIEFLDSADWRLEFEGAGVVTIPREPRPVVASRAYVEAHTTDVFLGNHYEAVVYLGPETQGDYCVPSFGMLKMYFDMQGRFVSEDRFAPK